MHITIRQLQVFASVARHLSFTRAAEELHLSQPAVSMQVKQLEGIVGLPLLEQIGKRVHLTQAGTTMQHYGGVIAEQIREAQEAIGELKGIEGGRLRISVATTVNYVAARLVAAFCRHHRGVEVSLDVTNRENLLRQLEDNKTDIVLMGQPPEGLNVAAEPFLDNPLVVIASPEFSIGRTRYIPFEQLQCETILIRERGSGTRLAMERFFTEIGIKPALTVEMTSNEAIKQSVEAGLGVGIVSGHTIKLEMEVGRLRILKVRSFPILRRWYVMHRTGKRLSAAANAFREFVLSEAGHFV
jgi:DNA-binding transcriptional LysR family regulator